MLKCVVVLLAVAAGYLCFHAWTSVAAGFGYLTGYLLDEQTTLGWAIGRLRSFGWVLLISLCNFIISIALIAAFMMPFRSLRCQYKSGTVVFVANRLRILNSQLHINDYKESIPDVLHSFIPALAGQTATSDVMRPAMTQVEATDLCVRDTFSKAAIYLYGWFCMTVCLSFVVNRHLTTYSWIYVQTQNFTLSLINIMTYEDMVYKQRDYLWGSVSENGQVTRSSIPNSKIDLYHLLSSKFFFMYVLPFIFRNV